VLNAEKFQLLFNLELKKGWPTREPHAVPKYISVGQFGLVSSNLKTGVQDILIWLQNLKAYKISLISKPISNESKSI
jgi:hypothetical protein